MFDLIKASLGLGPQPQGHFGWVKQPVDTRDHPFESLLSVAAPVALPASVDLRPGMPAVYDQGRLGACTSHAIAAAIQFDQKKQGLPVVMPSRLQLYFNERLLEGTVGQDAGAQIRDGFRVINQTGVCPESAWPYNISRFAVKPSYATYILGARHKSVKYGAVGQSEAGIKTALASQFPVVCGFLVMPSFETREVARTGIVPMPQAGEQALGGHAVIIVGFDDATQRFIVRNSWGPSFGIGGHFTIPYAYLLDLNLASDFWSVSLIS